MFLDRGSISGLVLGVGFIVAAIIMGREPNAFWNPSSVVIVLGGTIAATLVKFPFAYVRATPAVALQAFRSKNESPEELVALITKLAEHVRRESLLALENVRITDPFLKRAVGLAVDGHEAHLIESLLRSEAGAEVERHERGERIFRSLGQTAPAFGMIGTLIGLVQMLTVMDDPSKIGSAMAVAILTTFYGAFLAYVIFLPIADKLYERSRAEVVRREIAIQGVLGILEGQHPRLVQRRLFGLLGWGEIVAGKPPTNRLRPVA